jgi:hypothetical protein
MSLREQLNAHHADVEATDAAVQQAYAALEYMQAEVAQIRAETSEHVSSCGHRCGKTCASQALNAAELSDDQQGDESRQGLQGQRSSQSSSATTPVAATTKGQPQTCAHDKVVAELDTQQPSAKQEWGAASDNGVAFGSKTVHGGICIRSPPAGQAA